MSQYYNLQLTKQKLLLYQYLNRHHNTQLHCLDETLFYIQAEQMFLVIVESD